MTYLIDTNFCIELLNKRDSPAARKLASVSPPEVRLCSVVKAELYHGAYKGGREANLILVRSFSASFESLPFDDRCAEVYGRLRTELY
jgi:tRNA(fMet)-specific endonuclease VapC